MIVISLMGKGLTIMIVPLLTSVNGICDSWGLKWVKLLMVDLICIHAHLS